MEIPGHFSTEIDTEAFEAIARTLPLGSVSFENKTDERGERYVWLDHAVVSRLRAMRGSGESCSDVILRADTLTTSRLRNAGKF
jgi:hypothetical protein